MKNTKSVIALCVAISTLTGCSKALSKEEISKLSIKEAATEVCEAYKNLDADRIIAFLEDKDVQKTKEKLENGINYSAREKLEQSICTVTSVKEERRYTVVKFENFVKKIKIYKDENKLYKIKSLF